MPFGLILHLNLSELGAYVYVVFGVIPIFIIFAASEGWKRLALLSYLIEHLYQLLLLDVVAESSAEPEID